MKRRDFIKYGMGGLAALVVSSKVPWNFGEAHAAVPALNFTITDTIKEMATFNALSPRAASPPDAIVPVQQRMNNGECYFWIYKEATLPPDCPGPVIYATQGDTISISITNALDEPHNLFIPGLFNSGPIAPNATFTGNFVAKSPGTHLYYDSLNAPVNRVMGLHGCLIVMPKAKSGAKWTPYGAGQVTPQVQQLFDDLGTAAHWPGLAWEQGDPLTLTPPFRQYVWLCHQASPVLFAEVGDYPAGLDYPAAQFRSLFMQDTRKTDSFDVNLASRIPQYFTNNGQSGNFCHNNPVVVPMARVGEPVVLRVMNAGLMAHSMHLHANHYYVLAYNGKVQGNPDPLNATLAGPGPIWVDTFTLNPMQRYDGLIPFMRPPDIPNTRGIGRGGSPDAALPLASGVGTTYPPFEEFNVHMPELGTTALSPIDGTTPVSIAIRQSPLCYPMHDHSEPSQTSQGGNYNCGLIAGVYFIGDRNIQLNTYNIADNPALPQLPPQTFPMDEDFAMMIFAPDPAALTTGTARLVYGADQARVNGIMGCSRDSDLMSLADRPLWPPPFPPA